MSARIERVSTGGETRDAWTGTLVVVLGVAVLIARPFAQAATGSRIALFAASYLMIGLASLAVPLERERPHLAPGLALLWGFGAVVVAANASGSPVPLPWSASALPLSLLAAVAEEALFRRLAYARLVPFGAAVAVVGSALLFGLVHMPAYGVTALPVDVGAGLVFGWQRWASGTWTVPAATHAFANALVVLR